MCEEENEILSFLASAVKKKYKYLLHFAVEQSSSEYIDAAISLGCAINLEDEKGRTPIYLAAVRGKERMVRLLKERGGDIGSVLLLGASQGDSTLVANLLSWGADVDTLDHLGRSPLYRAAEGGHKDTIQLLLLKGAQLGFLLHLAAARGHSTALRSLISSGASVNTKDDEGKTAVYRAAQNGHQEAISVLLENGATTTYLLHSALTARDVSAVKHLLLSVATLKKRGFKNIQRSAIEKEILVDMHRQGEHIGKTLHYVAKNGNTQNVIWLLERGASIDYKDYSGLTPLYRACESGNIEVARLLIDRGVRLEDEVREGKRLLHCAVEAGNKTAVETLLAIGAEVNSFTSDGTSSLHLAAQQNFGEVLVLLLNHSANINIRDNSYFTPLMRAAIKGHVDVLWFLLKNGADVALMDKNGSTARYLASQQGHHKAVECLLNNGAEIDCWNSQRNFFHDRRF